MTINNEKTSGPGTASTGDADPRHADTGNENRVGGLPERQPSDRLSQNDPHPVGHDDNERSEKVIQPQRIRGNKDPDRARVDASED